MTAQSSHCMGAYTTLGSCLGVRIARIIVYREPGVFVLYLPQRSTQIGPSNNENRLPSQLLDGMSAQPSSS